jgi:hypothetical protein
MTRWRGLRFLPALAVCALIPATGASAASMEWSQLPITAEYASRLNSISCTSSTACTSVGFTRTALLGYLPLAKRWDGEHWSSQTIKPPPFEYVLNGVSCSSSTTCIAVGKVGSAPTAPVAARWEGGVWSSQLLSYPEEESEASEGASLQGISCPSSTFCMAVGSYKVSGKTYLLADSWNGKEWKESLVSGLALGMTLSAVSCSSSTSCTTVATPGAGNELLAWHWGGESWSSQMAFAPESAKASTLAGVSCPSSTACMAVGSYTSEGVQKTLAERWSGGEKWELKSTPNPSESGGSSFTAVSCPSAEACEATGTYRLTETGHPLVESWASGVWALDTLPEGGTALSGISCTSTSLCMATGYKGVEGYELLAEKGIR